MTSDGFNFTVTLDCGCTQRLNIQGSYPVPQVGDYWSCFTGQHSGVREYDSRTGDPIHERDRQAVAAQFDGSGEQS